MAPECCCRRPHEFQFCSVGRRFHSRGAATDNARSVISSPLGSWLEEVAVRRTLEARSEERYENVGEQREQVGDVVRRLTNQRLVHEDTMCGLIVRNVHFSPNSRANLYQNHEFYLKCA